MIQNLNKILRERMPDMVDQVVEESVSEDLSAVLDYINKSHNEIAEAIKVLAHNQRELLGIMKRIEEKVDKK